jgi:predicted Ser/Thr protein kinase
MLESPATLRPRKKVNVFSVLKRRLPVQEYQLLRKVLLKNELLKKDLFGEVWTATADGEDAVLRDTRPARWWLKWLARRLLRREARAMATLHEVDGMPQLISSDSKTLLRTFIVGVPLFEGQPDTAAYFNAAAKLLRRIHRNGVTHNDLAKEANILVCDDGSPAFIDFQLAAFASQRGRMFRIAAREDIRHLLKHKRTYRPDLLTTRERNILDSASPPSRAWMLLVKPLYMFVTRNLLGWSDREGAADR